LDHLHDFQLEAVVECSAFVGHENLLDRCIFHLSRCPGKLDHYTAKRPQQFIPTRMYRIDDCCAVERG
ncbi:hypothetical protein EYC95_30000, partial [Pseudomonas sp. BGI-2]